MSPASADPSGERPRRPAGRVALAGALGAAALLAASVLQLLPRTPAVAEATPFPRSAAHRAAEASAASGERPTCVFVSSYHRGYSWSDRLERGLRARMLDGCRIVRLDLDSKRRKTREEIQAAADRAFHTIVELDADVVLAADDNAVKHLVVPYLKGTRRPVVFAGVNWTVEEYGLPVPNVTGMVEVAPIAPMIRRAVELAPGARRATYVGASTLTEAKNYERIAESAKRFGVRLDAVYAADMAAWKRALAAAQERDFVIIGSSAGLDGWDDEEAAAHALAVTRRPSFTNHDWMMPVAAIGYTKVPEEQGEWAADSALAILGGMRPGDIPLVTNRKWDTWINEPLLAASGTRLPAALVDAAKRAGEGS